MAVTLSKTNLQPKRYKETAFAPWGLGLLVDKFRQTSPVKSAEFRRKAPNGREPSVRFYPLGLLTCMGTLRAQDNSQQRAALILIRETAADICNTVPIEGTDQRTDLTGAAQAKLNGIVGKIVDLGVSGAAKYQSGTYKGVLQQELAGAIKDGNDCKLSVLNTLVPQLLQSTTPQQAASSQPILIVDGSWRGKSNETGVNVTFHTGAEQADHCRPLIGTMTDMVPNANATNLTGSFCPEKGSIVFDREFKGKVCQKYTAGVGSSEIDGTFTVEAACGGSGTNQYLMHLAR